MSCGAKRWLWMRKTMKKGRYSFHTVSISLQSNVMSVLAVRMARLITGAMSSIAHIAR